MCCRLVAIEFVSWFVRASVFVTAGMMQDKLEVLARARLRILAVWLAAPVKQLQIMRSNPSQEEAGVACAPFVP